MIRRTPSAPSLLALALLLLPACRAMGGGSGREALLSLAQEGRYAEAHALARERLERRPDDPLARKDELDTRVAVTLAAGIELVFQGDPRAALEVFERAHELDPENAVVRDWTDKTRVQLAEEALDEAAAQGGRENLYAKRALLERALAYLPEADRGVRVERLRYLAEQGLEQVSETIAYCESKSADAYLDGIQAISEDRLWPALRDFSTSRDYDPTNERAVRQRENVDELLIERRLDQAQTYEELGLHDAARKEYLLVRKVSPENVQAREGLNRTELETRASRLLTEADLEVGRGNLEGALALVDEAAALTRSQEDAVESLRLRVREARWASLYDRAVALENDGRLPEAAAAYSALLGEAEFYGDARSRLAVVEEFVRDAEQLYAQALAAPSEAEALGLLRRIRIFWPTYRDVAERVAELERRLEPEPVPDSPTGGDADGSRE